MDTTPANRQGPESPPLANRILGRRDAIVLAQVGRGKALHLKMLLAEQLRDRPEILIDQLSPNPYNELPQSQPITVTTNPGGGISLCSLIPSSTRTNES